MMLSKPRNFWDPSFVQIQAISRNSEKIQKHSTKMVVVSFEQCHYFFFQITESQLTVVYIFAENKSILILSAFSILDYLFLSNLFGLFFPTVKHVFSFSRHYLLSTPSNWLYQTQLWITSLFSRSTSLPINKSQSSDTFKSLT